MAEGLWKETREAKVWVWRASWRISHTVMGTGHITPVCTKSWSLWFWFSCLGWFPWRNHGIHRPEHLKPCGGNPQLQERLSTTTKSWLISGDWWERALTLLVLVAIHHTATAASEHLTWYFYRSRQIQSESPDHGQSGEMVLPDAAPEH